MWKILKVSISKLRFFKRVETYVKNIGYNTILRPWNNKKYQFFGVNHKKVFNLKFDLIMSFFFNENDA